MRQQRMLAAVLAGVVLTSGAGWAAGSRMRSPAQVAADTAPPDPSLITAPVERRTLSSTVTTRGTVRYGEPQPVTLAASSLGGGGGQGGGSSLVTKPPEKGAVLEENAVALEVAGRPVHVLQGEVPMYRDLRPGDSGTDVRQLEEALARLGFRPGAVDGAYDVATEAAVDAWYEASGYTAQGPTDEQREALRAARAAVSGAEDQVLQAQEALETARKGATAKDLAMAEAEVRAAQRDRARAGEALDGARADEVSAKAAEGAARADEQAARQRLDEARRDGAAPAELAGLEVELAAAVSAARQAAERAVLASRAVPEAARAVAGADDKLAVAKVMLEDLTAPADTRMAEAKAAKAARDLDDARQQLAELDGEIGVVVPAGEVLFFSTLPLRVDEPKVARGDDGTQEIMVVSTSRLAIDASVSIPDATLVKVGDKVDIRSTELGIEATGVVTELASKPGTDGVDAQKVYMEVVPDDPPAELTGASVRLTISVQSTGGDVLAVPVAALSVGADGSSRVQVSGEGSRVRTVEVEPGLSAQGYVELKGAGGLKEGDRAVVGTKGQSSGTTGTNRNESKGGASSVVVGRG
jgi:hypothetical protein